MAYLSMLQVVLLIVLQTLILTKCGISVRLAANHSPIWGHISPNREFVSMVYFSFIPNRAIGYRPVPYCLIQIGNYAIDIHDRILLYLFQVKVNSYIISSAGSQDELMMVMNSG